MRISMLLSTRRLIVLLSLTVLFAGCSDSGSDSPQSAEQGASEAEETSAVEHEEHEEEQKDGLEYELDRSPVNVAGGWLFYVSQDQNEVPIAMLGVVARDQQNPSMDDLKVMILQPTKAGGKLEAGPSTVTPQTVQFQFQRDGQFQLFAGELKDGVIFGNILDAEGGCTMARMVRPKVAVQTEPLPSLAEGFFELTDILKEGGDWDQLVEFVETYPETPLTVNALYSLTSQVGPRGRNLDDIKQIFALIEEVISPWGNRMKQYSRLNSLVATMHTYRDSDFLESVRKSLVGEFPEPMWEERTSYALETLKEEIEYIKQVEALRASTSETRAEIMTQLEESRQKDLFNFNLIRSTAEALESIDEKEQALEWYLDYVSIPGLDSFYLNQFQMYAREATPTSQKLDTLWEDVHGSQDGLNAALEENYHDLLKSYELTGISIPEDTKRGVLVELFTGTACPPCIASDIAFSRLKQEFPQDRAIFLQYHVHVPAADPLAVEGSRGRYHYYAADGTPTYFVDGRKIEGTAGPASIAELTITRLSDEIVEELKVAPPLDIKVDVKSEGAGTASFKATVEAEELNDRWRLNVVLAEEVVHFRGPNQIPFHEMVVREVFTPSQGEPPKGDGLSYSGIIDPEKIRVSINGSLEQLRKERSVEVPNAPLELNNLYLVAFVQDTRNRRIRQAVSVPVPELSSAKVSSAE